MSSERNVNVFAALVLVLSIIGIILMATQYFAAFYLGGGNYRYSCLDCGYATAGDLFAQILMIIFLVLQIVIAINDLVPNKFIKMDLDKIGLIFAGTTVLLAIIGLATFGIVYAEYEWWPEAGFYGGIIAGLINTILFFLKWRNQ